MVNPFQISISDRVFQEPWRIRLAYAKKGGGPTLKDAPWWRDINGVFISTEGVNVWLTFRRPIAWRPFINDIRKKGYYVQ